MFKEILLVLVQKCIMLPSVYLFPLFKIVLMILRNPKRGEMALFYKRGMQKKGNDLKLEEYDTINVALVLELMY